VVNGVHSVVRGRRTATISALPRTYVQRFIKHNREKVHAGGGGTLPPGGISAAAAAHVQGACVEELGVCVCDASATAVVAAARSGEEEDEEEDEDWPPAFGPRHNGHLK
jgi:hypothetical protein